MKLVPAFLVSVPLVPCLQAQTTTLVSADSSGVHADGGSSSPSISADGRYLCFTTNSSNIVPGDTNAHEDVFVRDRLTGQVTRVSVDSAGAQGDGFAGGGVFSGDGTKLAFLSNSTNLVPGDVNGQWDVFVRDLGTGQMLLASVSSTGTQADSYSGAIALSSDGRFVAFESAATNLVAGDTNLNVDVFVHDTLTGRTVRASSAWNGAQPNDSCMQASITADGRWVAFQSSATNLVPGDTNGTRDIFLRDVWNEATTRVNLSSSGAQTGGNAALPKLTPDGRFLLFTSDGADVVPGDTNGSNDAFVRDLVTGVTTRESISSTGAQGTNSSASRDFSADGRYVLFVSDAANLVPGDTNLYWDDLVRDRKNGQTLRVSVGPTGVQGNGTSNFCALSADGRFVLFETSAFNFVANDVNGAPDVFLRDRGTLAALSFCFGDGTGLNPCPCANFGVAGRGCENSAGTGGARLSVEGFADPDSAVFSARDMLPSALAIFLQGNAAFAGTSFGDGLRCAGGLLLRLYTKTASEGSAGAPELWDLQLGVQSALLGDLLLPGTSRYYQTYYRDLDALFCPAPAGDLWNITNAVRVDW